MYCPVQKGGVSSSLLEILHPVLLSCLNTLSYLALLSCGRNQPSAVANEGDASTMRKPLQAVQGFRPESSPREMLVLPQQAPMSLLASGTGSQAQNQALGGAMRVTWSRGVRSRCPPSPWASASCSLKEQDTAIPSGNFSFSPRETLHLVSEAHVQPHLVLNSCY